MSAKTRAELALVGITIIWGSTFVLVKSALAGVSTILFLTLRFLLAAAVLAAIYRKSIRREGLVPGAAAGALLFVAYYFQTAGLILTTASKSAFLTGLSIPMVPLAAALVYRIRPRLFEAAGVVTATFGMALMTLPAAGLSINRGDLLSVLCAVAFAVHIVLISHYTPLVGFETLAVAQVTVAALLGLFSFRVAEPVRFQPAAGVLAAVLVTGLLATALAFTVMAWAQNYTTATRSALIFALEPVVAWITSYLLFRETLSLRGEAGAALILAGVLLVELKRGDSETNAAAQTSL